MEIKKLLKSNFSQTTIKKGEDYYKEGRVIDFKVITEDESFIHLTSRVRGNYEDVYYQDIKIYLDEEFVEGECTCPVGEDCKHVVAVLYSYFNQKEKSKYNSENWFKSLITSLSNIEEKNSSKYKLIFRIFLLRDYSHQLIPEKALLENEVVKKSEIISLNALINNPNRDYITKKDKEIIKLMEKIFIYHSLYTNDIIYDVILKDLISQKKLYFETNIYPIKGLKFKKLKLRWENIGDKYILKTNLDKEKLIFAHSIFEYLPSENILYQIEPEINEYLLKSFLNAQPLSKEETAKLYFLLKNYGYDVENLDFTEEIEIKDKPVPVLKISYNQEKNFINIEFKIKYGNYYFAPLSEEKSIIYEDLKIITILRDLKQEEEYERRLKNTNLKKITFSSGRYFVDLESSYIEEIYQFLENEIKQLKSEGWEIEYETKIPEFESGKINFEIKEEDSWWFDISVKIKLGDEEVDLLPILKEILANYNVKKLPEIIFVKHSQNKILRIERNDIKPIIDTIFNLYRKKDTEDLKISKAEIHLIEDKLIDNEEIKKLREKLLNFNKIQKISQPKNLKAKLRDYQIEGISWINFLYEYGFNGILADDMGLGKTIQVLSFLQYLKENNRLNNPSLIVVPTTLISNWEKEIQKFTPDLKFITIYGKDRKSLIENIKDKDIVLTTYSLIQSDYELYKDKQFLYLILDESQKVKNPKTKTYKAVKEIKAQHKLALSGTPIENNLTELWGIFNILMPGFLGTHQEFSEIYKTPIEKYDDKDAKRNLSKKIKPFILRRTKKEVLKELPQKLEIVKYTKFSEKQAKLYESVKASLNKEIRELLKKQGIEKSQIHILDALLKLRQICCHPLLLKIDTKQKVKESAKLELLEDILEDLIEEDRKILIFSQFVEMLNIIESEVLNKKGYQYLKLTGQTRGREKVIDEFKKNPDIKIFLISLKAGGVGLNLTEADTVIIYDPWWNPFAENQAVDRAYRIGQDKPVFVYKLIVENSIEEKILKLQEKKKQLQEIYHEKADIFKISKEEILSLLD